jgi:hypothetical protein
MGFAENTVRWEEVMSPRCSKSHYRGDVGKVEELFVELESDEEL